MANFTPGVVPSLRPPAKTAPSFRAKVTADDVNFVVHAPASVSEWFGGRGPVPVLGLVNGVGIRATLIPAGGGRHRLFLNGEMRAATGLNAGSIASVRLWRDDATRDPALPRDVQRALRAAGVLDRFLAWSPSHQREYLVTIEDAKQQEMRALRIRRTIAALKARER